MQDAGSADAPGLVAEAEATLAALEQALSAWRLAALLGGPYDAGGAVVSIQVPQPGLLAWWAVRWGSVAFCWACAFQAKSCSGMALL